MVRALPGNPWWDAEFLQRIRPGLAVSAALHIGLLLALAYFLAFHPATQTPTDDKNNPIGFYVIPPPLPPKPQPPVKPPTFKPTVAPPIDHVPIPTDILPLPPVTHYDKDPAVNVTQAEPMALPTIIDPQPVYRGGLVFPERALDRGIGGYVDFDFIIEPDGSVGNPVVTVEVPDGLGFATAAKKAFPRWKFKPMMVNGKPVAAPAHIRVTFKMQ